MGKIESGAIYYIDEKHKIKHVVSKENRDDMIKRLVMTGIVIVCVILNIVCDNFLSYLDYKIAITCFGTIIAASLCGNMAGIITALITIVYTYVTSETTISQDYLSAITFMIVFCSALFAYISWYKSIIKTFFATAVYSIVSGGLYYIVSYLVDNNGLYSSVVPDIFFEILYAFPVCLLASLSVYCILHFTKDEYLTYIKNGHLYYKKSHPLTQDEIRIYRKRSLSSRLTVIIVIMSVILCLSSVIVANFLYMDMGGSIGGGFFQNSQASTMQQEASTETAASTQTASTEAAATTQEASTEASVTTQDASTEAAATTQEASTEAAVHTQEASTEAAVHTQEASTEAAATTQEASTEAAASTQTAELQPSPPPDIINGWQYFSQNGMKLSFDFRLMMILLCIAIIVASVANEFAQRKIAKPISRMSHAMNTFAFNSEEGRINSIHNIHDLYISTGDEIETLYKSMDKVTNDVTVYLDKMAEERKLEEDLEIAKRTSEAKSTFLSNMSHEIRTPINAVLGLDEMILRECEDQTIHQYAADIKNAGKTLLSLVNDILDFSKIEAGKLEIIPVEYELSSVLNDLVNMIYVKANDKKLSFNIIVNESMPHILIGDEIRIKQIIINILTNAVKYTEQGGVTLSVDYEKAGDEQADITVHIKDTGIGIKQEDIKKLFAPFERIEEKRNRTIEGTGLGMSITKQLLDKMNSKLEVSSVYGRGSDFSFTIRQKVANWEPMGDFEKRYADSAAGMKKYHESFTAPDAKILVIDDTKMNLTVISGLLKKTKIQIDTGTSGFECLDMITKVKYDLIFLDHRMPQMDGMETFAKMKELSSNLNKGVPVIALTANAVSGAREGYINAGFSDYLSKPIDPVRLETVISKMLPQNKVNRYNTGESASDVKTDTDSAEIQKKKAAFDYLNTISGIDAKAGLSNCGNPETYLNVINEFYESINSKAEDIENALKNKDFKNYTVYVHALKSSARLLGANSLSDNAKYLELCGNTAEKSPELEPGIKEILSETPELLKEYRSFLDILRPICDNKDDDNLPLIDDSSLNDAISALREFVDAFDFDDADGIMKTLSQYSMPEYFKEKYTLLKKLMNEVAREEILKLLT